MSAYSIERELALSPILSEGEASFNNIEEAALYIQQILHEKSSLKTQNSQLWKIIQKQRLIIQQLQKSLATRDSLNGLDLELETVKEESKPETLSPTSGGKWLASKSVGSEFPTLIKNYEASKVPKMESRHKSERHNKDKDQTRTNSKASPIVKASYRKSLTYTSSHSSQTEKTTKHNRSKTYASPNLLLKEGELIASPLSQRKGSSFSSPDSSYKSDVRTHSICASNSDSAHVKSNKPATDDIKSMARGLATKENIVIPKVDEYNIKKPIPLVVSDEDDLNYAPHQSIHSNGGDAIKNAIDEMHRASVDFANIPEIKRQSLANIKRRSKSVEHIVSSTISSPEADTDLPLAEDLLSRKTSSDSGSIRSLYDRYQPEPEQIQLLDQTNLIASPIIASPSKRSSSGTIRSLPEGIKNKRHDKSLVRQSSLPHSLSLANQLYKPEEDSDDDTEPISETASEPIINPEPHHALSPPSFSRTRSKSSDLKNLDDIIVQVASSSVKTNSKGKEVLVFRIQIGKRHSKGPEFGSSLTLHHSAPSFYTLWTIEKYFSDFLDLDSKFKTTSGYAKTKSLKLPEKKSLNTISPSKIDQRKIALQNYLQNAINNDRQIPSFVSEFIFNGRIDEAELSQITGFKEGYLIKRGKNFGKWKRRYFIIKGGVLEYYETKNGQKLGSILLNKAQVAVQHTSSLEYEPEVTASDTFRHAFMILEPKKNSQTMHRHVLCADSDQERDEWVKTLAFYLNGEAKTIGTYGNSMDESINSSPNSESMPKNVDSVDERTDTPLILSGSETTTSPTATSELSHPHLITSQTLNPSQSASSLGSFSSSNGDVRPPEMFIPPKSSNRVIKPKVDPFNGKSLLLGKSKNKEDRDSSQGKEKARSKYFWTKSFFSSESSKTKPAQLPVFGVPLKQSIAASRVSEGYELSSVVYRCIQYMDVKLAHEEEGIYRLSGSSVTIRALKTKFDTEGDYAILESGIYYDVHAVAGLLKLYLRELPSTVLTAELHKDFMLITDLLNRKERVRELGRLICSLPIENYTLLRALIGHLISVIQNSEVNKMTLRNVAIVFSPTLGIPAGVFSLLIAEFEYIFFVNPDGAAAPQEISDDEGNCEEEIKSVPMGDPNVFLSIQPPSSPPNLSEVLSSNPEVAFGNAFSSVEMVETHSRRRARHRRTVSAGTGFDLAKAYGDINLSEVQSKTGTKPRLTKDSNQSNAEDDDRPTSSYSDTSYLAPAYSKAALKVARPTKMDTIPDPEANEVQFHTPELSPKELDKGAETDLSKVGSPQTLHKSRSNRNSMMYRNRAPPEIARLEQNLDTLSPIHDEVNDEDALNHDHDLTS